MSGYWPPSAANMADFGDWFEQDTEPSSPADGDKWLDTSASPPVWKRWDGTAWVTLGGSGGADLSDADPEPAGTADPGTSTEASRADHVHPDSGGEGGGAEVAVSDLDPYDADPDSTVQVWFDLSTSSIHA